LGQIRDFKIGIYAASPLSTLKGWEQSLFGSKLG